MTGNLMKAKYSEWQLSLWGACFVAFGLGFLFEKYLPATAVYILILVGIAMHGMGMYSIRQKNK